MYAIRSYYDNYCLNGRHHGKRYQLGDPVKVEVLRANLARKQLDFALVEEETESPAKPKYRK